MAPSICRRRTSIYEYLPGNTPLLFFTRQKHLTEVVRKAVGELASTLSLKPRRAPSINATQVA